MKRISQQAWEKADCGIACVAMVTDAEYRDSFNQLAQHERKGLFHTRHNQLIEAIKLLGKHAQKRKFKSFDSISTRAIIAVNEDSDGNWHWIAFNGFNDKKYAYDPSPEVKDKLDLSSLSKNYIPKVKSFYIEVVDT